MKRIINSILFVLVFSFVVVFDVSAQTPTKIFILKTKTEKITEVIPAKKSVVNFVRTDALLFYD